MFSVWFPQCTDVPFVCVLGYGTNKRLICALGGDTYARLGRGIHV